MGNTTVRILESVHKHTQSSHLGYFRFLSLQPLPDCLECRIILLQLEDPLSNLQFLLGINRLLIQQIIEPLEGRPLTHQDIRIAVHFLLNDLVNILHPDDPPIIDGKARVLHPRPLRLELLLIKRLILVLSHLYLPILFHRQSGLARLVDIDQIELLDLVVPEGLVVLEVKATEIASAVLEVFADLLVAKEGYLSFAVRGVVVRDYDRCYCEFVIVVVDDYAVRDVLVVRGYLNSIK